MDNNRKWAKKFDNCLGCSTTEKGHWARGYCSSCYPKLFLRRRNLPISKEDIANRISITNRIKKNASIKINTILDKSTLKDLYHNQKRSFGDIAKKFNCSRAYILKLCRKYNVRIKSKSEARLESMHFLVEDGTAARFNNPTG